MAKLNFPDPNSVQTFTKAGVTWTWNSTYQVWSSEVGSVSGGANVSVGPTPPSNAEQGDLWWADTDVNDGGGRLYAEIIDAEQTGIRPGAFVKIDFVGRSFENVAIIPEEALFGDNLVYINDNGVARAKIANVVWRAPGEVYVQGIADDTKLIATRLPGIGDGVRVRTATQ